MGYAAPVAIEVAPYSKPRYSSPWGVHSSDRADGAGLLAIPAPLEPGDSSHLAGAAITVVDDGQRVAPLVAGLLESHGATALVVGPDGIPVTSDGIIHLGQLHVATRTATDLYDDVYPVAKAGATTVVAVTGLGGTYGQCVGERAERGYGCERGKVSVSADRFVGGAHAGGADPSPGQPSVGIADLLGALAEELPGANVRAVDLDCFDDPVVLAGRIVAEALASGGPVAVAYPNDRRCTLVSADDALMSDDTEPQMTRGCTRRQMIWGRIEEVADRHTKSAMLEIV
jgi:hypothetical protein